MADDNLTAYLAEARERAEKERRYICAAPEGPAWSCEDVPVLLVMVEAVLSPHQPGRHVIIGDLCERHENHAHFSITAPEAAGVEACEDCAATTYLSCDGCGTHVRMDSCRIRSRIERHLPGEDGADD